MPGTGSQHTIPRLIPAPVAEIAPQGGFYFGGIQQIVIPKPWTIQGVEVLGSYPLK